MRTRRERLGESAAVKGTMLLAHLGWASAHFPDVALALGPHLTPDCVSVISSTILATDWVPFRTLVGLDKAIIAAVGADPDEIHRQLGRYSANLNLKGVYRSYVAGEPHTFFEKVALLHGRFQNFGRARYERLDDRSGRAIVEGYEEYSPGFCASSVGYCEEALQLMQVPGPIVVTESSCQCAADPMCVFQLAW